MSSMQIQQSPCREKREEGVTAQRQTRGKRPESTELLGAREVVELQSLEEFKETLEVALSTMVWSV